MVTRPLSTTLRHLHVRIHDGGRDVFFRVSKMKIAFCMSSLRTFTFVKSLYERFPDEWTFIDALTSSTVMPVLQRTKFIISLALSDLNRIGRSALFNDHRRVDVQYAFILNDDLSHTDLDQQIPRGSRYHPRPVVSATFVRTTWDEQKPYALPDKHYVSFSFDRSLARSLSITRSTPIPCQWLRFACCRASIQQIDLICGTPCHGPSMNSFKCRSPRSTSAKWKYGNQLVHQRCSVRLVSFGWTWSAMTCHLFSLDRRSSVRRTSKNCVYSVVTETSIWHYHRSVIWMSSVVSMHCIVVRRFQWTFSRSSLDYSDGTFHISLATGLHCVLFAHYLTCGRCVWFWSACICLRMTRVVRLSPRLRCGSSISPSLFDGHQNFMASIFTRHSQSAVRLLNSFDNESLIYPGTRHPSVLLRKMVVDWWCGVNNDIKVQDKLLDLVENKCPVFFFVMFGGWWTYVRIKNHCARLILARCQITREHSTVRGCKDSLELNAKYLFQFPVSFASH